MPPADAFHWQGFFQKSREPLFVLNRQRRLVFANHAWEALTGQPFAQARGKTCTRRLSDDPLSPLLRALWPPPEVLQGQTVRVPRAVPPAAGGPPWWHVEFFPLMGDEGVLGILGRIRADAAPVPAAAPRLPEAWAALREQAARRFDFDLWASELPALHCVVAQVRLAAQSRCPVRIVGEAGTGKHWLARTIHHRGVTAAAPFVALDCARLPPAALEGVLSGPLGLDRPDGAGTLYLREPSALAHDWQQRLADHVADAGGRGPRLIAGFRPEPAAAVQSGRLLDRLGAGLGVVAITLP